MRKSYRKKTALAGIDLAVGRGETVVIMGPSGCGKSTLIRCLNRLTEPDAGRIVLDGTEVTELDRPGLLALRQRIGFVFQHFNLVRRLPALDNVSMSLRLHGVERAEAEARAARALARVGLAHKLHDLPEEMSGGEQQRVSIARALVGEPELMLWDEPTASLDPILVGEVLEVMESLVRESHTTMVVVTHELSFACHAADRVVLLDRGRIVEQGAPQDVFCNPVSEIGRKYKNLLKHQPEMVL
ncbi:MAG: amino acid ABC transporter ATP-binding protein [Patescibacteria group bacterium]